MRTRWTEDEDRGEVIGFDLLVLCESGATREVTRLGPDEAVAHQSALLGRGITQVLRTRPIFAREFRERFLSP